MALKQRIDEASPGAAEVVLIVGKDAAKQAIRLPQKVALTTELEKSLQTIFGAENVKK